MQTTIERERLNPKEARQHCGNIFSDYSLKRSRSTGKLLGLPAPGFIRIGSRICYERSVLDAWISAHAKRLNNTAA